MKIIISLIIFLTTTSLYAQVTLKECLQLAVKKNNLLLAYHDNVMAKKSAYHLKKLERIPEFDITPSFDGRTYTNYASPINGHYSWINSTIALGLSINLSRMFSSYSKSSGYRFKRAKLTEHFIREKIKFEVKRVYYKLLVIKKRKALLEKAIGEISRNIIIIRRIARYGARKYRLTLLRFQTESENMLVTLNETKSKEKQFREKLKSLTGLKEIGKISPVQEKLFSVNKIKDVGNFLPLKILSFQRKILENELSKKKIDWLPKLFFEGSYVFNGDFTDNLNGNYFEFRGGLTFPLGAIYKKSSEIKNLKSRLKMAGHKYKEEERKIKLRYANLIEMIQTGQSNYKLLSKTGVKARYAFILAKKDYRLGMIQETDMFDTYRKWVELMMSLNKIYLQYLINIAEVEFISASSLNCK